ETPCRVVEYIAMPSMDGEIESVTPGERVMLLDRSPLGGDSGGPGGGGDAQPASSLHAAIDDEVLPVEPVAPPAPTAAFAATGGSSGMGLFSRIGDALEERAIKGEAEQAVHRLYGDGDVAEEKLSGAWLIDEL